MSWQGGEPVPEPSRIPADWTLSEEELVRTLARVGYAPDGGPASRAEQTALDRFSSHDFNAP